MASNKRTSAAPTATPRMTNACTGGPANVMLGTGTRLRRRSAQTCCRFLSFRNRRRRKRYVSKPSELDTQLIQLRYSRVSRLPETLHR